MKKKQRTNQSQLSRTRELALRTLSEGDLASVTGGLAPGGHGTVYARPIIRP